MDISKIFKIAGAGLAAQNTRLRIIAENIANADTLGATPGAEPYARKVVSFRNVLDKELGVDVVEVDRISRIRVGFGRRHQPNHPAADKDGFVKTSNVQTMIEMMDLRVAQRSYEANLQVIRMARSMVQQTLQILQ